MEQYEAAESDKENRALYNRLYKTEAGNVFSGNCILKAMRAFMRDTSLVYPVRKDGRILLGHKRRGMGAGKWNGFGGKREDGETMRECAARELFEESGLIADPKAFEAAGRFIFPSAPIQLVSCGIVILYLRRGRGQCIVPMRWTKWSFGSQFLSKT